jgi:hypothetical protein
MSPAGQGLARPRSAPTGSWSDKPASAASTSSRARSGLPVRGRKPASRASGSTAVPSKVDRINGNVGVAAKPTLPLGGAAIQTAVQDMPLRVKELGLPVSPVWVAWKPMVVEAFGAIMAFCVASRAVTWPDDGE